MDIQKYVKDEGFNPFASDETVIETMKAQAEDRELIKGEGIFSESQTQKKPSGFNQLISCNWIDPDFFWGWRVKMLGEKPSGFMTLLTVKDFHSVELWPRVKMGGPARAAICDTTAGLNCLFAMRRFCPMIEITSTYDGTILVGQTIETENTSFENNEGIITQTGVQRVVETGEQVGTYTAICKDLKHEV